LKAGWQDHLPSRAYIQKPKRQCWQANWTCHLPETPVEILTNRQSWKTTWQCHSLQALVEANTKHQDVKTGWQSFGGSKLCLTWNLKTKRQCLQTAWNVTCSRLWWLWWKFWNSQCLKTTWQCHSLQAKLWCKVNTPKVTVWRMVGKNTRSKLCPKWKPNIQVSRPVGRVTRPKLWLTWLPKAKVWTLLIYSHSAALSAKSSACQVSSYIAK
jgi:hypothetical protein